MGLSNLLISYGLTRDSFIWFWSRVSAGALLIVSGVVPLDNYISPKWQKVLTAICVIIIWLSGKYDSSPLPGKKI